MIALPASRRLAIGVAAVLLSPAGLLPAAAAGTSEAATAAPRRLVPENRIESRAADLLRAGRPVAALKLLRRTLQDRPDDLALLFLAGRAGIAAAGRKGAGDKARTAFLDAAIAALRRMLAIRPGLVRVRLELARAHFLKREDTLAREHFERVLAGGPHPAIAANVRRFLAQIRARRRWSLQAGAALAPDTNIGRSSGERTIYLFGLPFRRSEDSLPRSGIGLSVWAGGEYQHPVGPRLRLRAGASLFRREYGGVEFDRTFLSGHAGPRWLIDAETEASLLASARRLWRAGAPDFDEYGVRLEASRRFGRRMTAAVLASRHERRHRLTTWLDGPVTDLSLRADLVAAPAVRLSAAAGWARERPDDDGARRYRHTRWWVQPGISVDLPGGITLGASAAWRWTGFDAGFGALTLSGRPRRDRSRIVRVSVHKRDWTLFGFAPRISLVHERRTSNTQGAAYTRTGAELSVLRRF